MTMLAAEKQKKDKLSLLSYDSIVLVISGCLMLGSSIIPWLNDPWGASYSAWNVPIDIGWQLHAHKFNYGLLCTCAAIYTFINAYAYWRPCGKFGYIKARRVTVGAICVFPVILFVVQYTLIDFDSVNLLAQHKIQMLLVQHHYGYRVAAQIFPLQPFTLDISSFGGRVQLFVDQASFGVLLPCVSLAVLLFGKRSTVSPTQKYKKGIWVVAALLLLMVLSILGRAPLGLVYEQQATIALANGDYLGALSLLDKARFLNPSLDHVAFYHIERGQAEYFLHINRLNNDSHLYLAFTYRGQRGTLDAYQQLLPLSQLHSPPSWIVDEVSLTLEQLIELDGPLRRSAPVLDVTSGSLKNDTIALQWLQPLLRVDANNLYAQYITGVAQYDLHSYELSVNQLNESLHLSSDLDFQSSVYTFIALDAIKQGDYSRGRALLLLAEQLDPAYRNNAAREELSGLR